MRYPLAVPTRASFARANGAAHKPCPSARKKGKEREGERETNPRLQRFRYVVRTGHKSDGQASHLIPRKGGKQVRQNVIRLEAVKLIAVHKVLCLLLTSKEEHSGAHLLACDKRARQEMNYVARRRQRKDGRRRPKASPAAF